MMTPPSSVSPLTVCGDGGAAALKSDAGELDVVAPPVEHAIAAILTRVASSHVAVRSDGAPHAGVLCASAAIDALPVPTAPHVATTLTFAAALLVPARQHSQSSGTSAPPAVSVPPTWREPPTSVGVVEPAFVITLVLTDDAVPDAAPALVHATAATAICAASSHVAVCSPAAPHDGVVAVVVAMLALAVPTAPHVAVIGAAVPELQQSQSAEASAPPAVIVPPAESVSVAGSCGVADEVAAVVMVASVDDVVFGAVALARHAIAAILVSTTSIHATFWIPAAPHAGVPTPPLPAVVMVGVPAPAVLQLAASAVTLDLAEAQHSQSVASSTPPAVMV